MAAICAAAPIKFNYHFRHCKARLVTVIYCVSSALQEFDRYLYLYLFGSFIQRNNSNLFDRQQKLSFAEQVDATLWM